MESYIKSKKVLPPTIMENYYQLKRLSDYIDLASSLIPPNTTNYRASILQEFYQRHSSHNQTAAQISDEMNMSQEDAIRLLKQSCDVIASNLKLLFSNILVFCTKQEVVNRTTNKSLYSAFKATENSQLQSYYCYILNNTTEVYGTINTTVFKTIYNSSCDKEALKYLSYRLPKTTYQKRKTLLKKAKTILGIYLYGINYLTAPMGFTVTIAGTANPHTLNKAKEP